MSATFKLVKYLEWCTKLPEEGCPRKSPVFFLKNCECSFRFGLEEALGGIFYELDIEVKSGNSRWEACDVKLFVGFKKEEENLSLFQHSFQVLDYGTEEIWCISMKELRQKIPSDSIREIKFRFYFEGVTEHLLMHRTEMESKCIQTGCYLNGDVPQETLTEHMAKLFDSGENSDAEIKCGELVLKVHKAFLCARSEVFKAMFQNNMMEIPLCVQDIDVTYIKDFVRYLYTEEMPEMTFEKAKVLYEAGHKYAVQTLVLRCSKYLQDNLSIRNALECLTLSDAYSDEPLKSSIITFALENKMYLQEKRWLPFCEGYPKVALEVYRLSYKKSRKRKLQ